MKGSFVACCWLKLNEIDDKTSDNEEGEIEREMWRPQQQRVGRVWVSNTHVNCDVSTTAAEFEVNLDAISYHIDERGICSVEAKNDDVSN